MNRLGKFVLIFSTIGIILACNYPSAAPTPTSQPNVATIVASTLQVVTAVAQTSAAQTPAITPTATASPTPQALPVSYVNINLLIPSNLANNTTNVTTTDIEPPYINPSAGQMPQHTKIILNGYPVQGASWQPQILVFRADQYAHYGNGNQQFISGLRNLHYQHGQSLPGNLPSGQFNADIQSVNFVNGTGIRYLTQFDESPLPANNRELFYYFHGITNDGNYYVQVILPVQAPFLAPDENPNSPLPRNGIPFHSDQSYFNAIAQQLNATPPDQFSPSLTSLDALIQSITVTP
ncbi:MAG: hypothetical protein WBW94_08740 [Anaerolineales bacterium]